MAERNRVQVSMIGMGYYDTITPAVIQRNVLENPGWYTAYTPYQAEVSQGRLEALLNFQQMVIDLTGLELANASLLDEATAAAEAMAMARRVGKSGANAFFVDVDCHPQTLAVLRTRARGFGLDIVVGDPFRDLQPAEVFGALLHYPGSSGAVRDFRPVIEQLHGAGALAVMATDLLSLVRADAARRARRRRGDRQRPALRRADGLRRAACRVLRDARRLQARRARPPDRGVGGCARPPGAAHGAADPRAAHPAREGDQQHLHGAGPARRDGRRCTRSITAPKVSAGSRGGCTASPGFWPPAWRIAASR